MIFAIPTQAGSTPPLTSHTFSGTQGQNGWFVSTVDVELRVSDLESGPKQTTYWLGSDPSESKVYTSGSNLVLNPSFEAGSFEEGPDDWDAQGNALFWRSAAEQKLGSYSAALAAQDTNFSYWHNRENPIATVPLQSYSVSVWVKTYDISGLGAHFEVWSKGASWNEDELIAESDTISGSNDWTLLTTSFISPTGFNEVYLRLGAQEELLIGVTYWDGVSVYSGSEAETSFTVVQNGDHLLHYFSEDNNGNIESEKTAPLKIDTRAPSDWANFNYTQGGNNHSYLVNIEVKDVTAGADVSEAKYRYYTDHQDQGWSDWFVVQQVLRVSDGTPALDGETSAIRLETPEIDFGDSATIFSVQFQLSDLAGNSSDSSAQTVEGPWIKLERGDLYVGGNINMSASAPAMDNSDALISVGGSINNFSTGTNWKATTYAHTREDTDQIGDLVDNFDDLKQTASSLPQQNLPTSSGLYRYVGDYTIDSQSMPAGFEDNVLSAVVIISGDLRVKISYSLQTQSAVVFMVEGDLEVEGAVEQMDGFFIVEEEINTNINNKLKRQLLVNGGMISLEGFVLGRNLGRTGAMNNTTDPSELFRYAPQYLLDDRLINLISGDNVDYTWREVEP